MRRILDLDILLLVSGIARKHGIAPKPFSRHPHYSPPPKKSIFFQEQEISQEREFVASQIGDYKKMFLILQTYLGGQSYYSPQFSLSPPNPVSSWKTLDWGEKGGNYLGATKTCSSRNENLSCSLQSREDFFALNK
jgi:hypothetical protein